LRSSIVAILMASVSTGVSLLAAEFGLRWLNADITTTDDNASYFARRWYRENPTRVNSLGFREDEVPAKGPDTYRIAVIGDSFTFGQGISEEHRFSNRLEKRLNRHGDAFEVLNFGRPGAETHHHLRFLEETVLDQSPDFVLLQWFVNDVELSHEGRPRVRQLIPGRKLSKWLHSRSALCFLLNRRFAALQNASGMAETYVENMRRRFTDPSTEESKAASDALDDLITTIKENDLPMGIVLFPLLVDVSGDPTAYPLGFLMDRVLDACRRMEIECLDLRPAFSKVARSRDLWVNRYDRHPNAMANEIAADTVHDVFAANWIDARRGR